MAHSLSGDGLVLMWSGGKDAMLTLDVLHSQSPRRVDALLTTVVEEVDTVTMHGTPLALIERQAAALDIPLHVMRVPPNASNATYEERLERALGPLLAEGVGTVAAGDLFLEDVKAYRERVLNTVGGKPLFPLWKRDTTWLAHRFVERGYRAVVTSVDQTQLDGNFVGRTYDESFLDDLPDGVDPCGEHGAFHTFVMDGPPFQAPVSVEVGEPHGEGRMRYVRLHVPDEEPSE
mgnify:CR=1 FL=1|jgi:uncharacterized protein (TIGR00290 family)